MENNFAVARTNSVRKVVVRCVHCNSKIERFNMVARAVCYPCKMKIGRIRHRLRNYKLKKIISDSDYNREISIIRNAKWVSKKYADEDSYPKKQKSELDGARIINMLTPSMVDVIIELEDGTTKVLKITLFELIKYMVEGYG